MSKKILIIDDDKINMALIRGVLEAKKYVVAAAEDGDVGLLKVKSEKPDLILLDIEMPNMNGYTFMSELKKMDGFSSIPIIVMTAHANMEPIFKLKGVKDYCVKPFQMEPFLQKIEQCLS